ncbi:MAG: hypothetical protein ACYTG7_17790 [Planctomycetota bacterium]|jgi:hypothetical protein
MSAIRFEFVRRKRRTRGFTIVEATICLVLMTVSFGAFLGVALQSINDFVFFSAHTKVGQWCQQRLNDIREDTLSVKQYFDSFNVSVMSQEYYNVLDLPLNSPPLNNTVILPQIEETGAFEPDSVSGINKTGNALFFVRSLEPFAVRVQTDPNIADPADWHIYRVPVYSFVLYYLTRRVNEQIGNSLDSLDLIRWSSLAVADYDQVMQFEELVQDGALECYPRAQVITAFMNEYGSEYLWVNGADLDQGFYHCYPDGTHNVMPEDPTTLVIAMEQWQGLFSRMQNNGNNHVKGASVFMNRGSQGFEIGPIVPQFATVIAGGDGFPHGFEVQIVGPSGAREVLLKLVLAKSGAQRIVARDLKAVLTTRDY